MGLESTCSLKMTREGSVVTSFSPEKEFTLQSKRWGGEMGRRPLVPTQGQRRGTGEGGGEQRLHRPRRRGSRAMALHSEKRKKKKLEEIKATYRLEE